MKYRSAILLMLNHFLLVFILMALIMFFLSGLWTTMLDLRGRALISFLQTVGVVTLLASVLYVLLRGFVRITMTNEGATFSYPFKEPVHLRYGRFTCTARVLSAGKSNYCWVLVVSNDVNTFSLRLPNLGTATCNAIFAVLRRNAAALYADANLDASFSLPSSTMRTIYRKTRRSEVLIWFAMWFSMVFIMISMYFRELPGPFHGNIALLLLVAVFTLAFFHGRKELNQQFEKRMVQIPSTISIHADGIAVDDFHAPFSEIRRISLTAPSCSKVTLHLPRELTIHTVKEEKTFTLGTGGGGIFRTKPMFAEYEQLFGCLERVAAVQRIPLEYYV